MNLRLFLAQSYLPYSYRRAGLIELYKITADAFGQTRKNFPVTQNYQTLLEDYAQFTKSQAEQALITVESALTAKNRLYQGAYSLGTRLRQELRIQNYADFCRAIRLIYRALQIDFTCNPAREVTVRKCFFRAYYSAPVCTLISALDSGLIAGLSGGGKMFFYQRLTENATCCKGRILE